MSYPLPDRLIKLPDSELKQLMQKVIRFQNSETVKAMRRMGIYYELNYGVSIPELRQLANQYQPNHQLAGELIQQNIREAIILASMLDDPLQISAVETELYLGMANNIELVEQFSRNLFAKIPTIPASIEKWIEHGDEWKQITAFTTLGWFFKFKKMVEKQEQDFSLKLISDFSVYENHHLMKAIGFAMQSLAGYSVELGEKVGDLAEKMIRSENYSVHQIGQEFLWLNTK